MQTQEWKQNKMSAVTVANEHTCLTTALSVTLVFPSIFGVIVAAVVVVAVVVVSSEAAVVRPGVVDPAVLFGAVVVVGAVVLGVVVVVVVVVRRGAVVEIVVVVEGEVLVVVVGSGSVVVIVASPTRLGVGAVGVVLVGGSVVVVWANASAVVVVARAASIRTSLSIFCSSANDFAIKSVAAGSFTKRMSVTQLSFCESRARHASSACCLVTFGFVGKGTPPLVSSRRRDLPCTHCPVAPAISLVLR